MLAMEPNLETRVDVVVVGAGLSGLAAAHAVVASGRTVRVLEANDRVGGRTLSRPLGEGVFDLGGQWLGPDQPRMLRLCRTLGVELFATHHEGTKLAWDGQRLVRSPGTIPRLPPHALLDLHFGVKRLDAVTARVRRGAVRTDPWHRALDSRSLADWLTENLRTRGAREVVVPALRVVFGADPEEVSALYAFQYAQAGGGFMKLIEVEGGAQQWRFVRGAQAVSLAMAEALGGRVRLGAPVRRVRADDAGVEVECADERVRASHAIIAVPPPLYAAIDFDPVLPIARSQLAQRMPMGGTVKAHVLYERPFWREAGLSGEAVCTRGPVAVTFDNTSHDGAQPALLAFIVGDTARRWSTRPADARRGEVLDVLRALFGDAAGRPTQYLEHDWSTQRWSLGCPTANLPPGSMFVCGDALDSPRVGRLHFAGTETASTWPGYMEGAVEAGERAAEACLTGA